jgi:hypothetical protein
MDTGLEISMTDVQKLGCSVALLLDYGHEATFCGKLGRTPQTYMSVDPR